MVASGAARDAALGDAIFAAILLINAGYAVATVGHFHGIWTLTAFGARWDAQGFCVSFEGTWFHTHLLCLYGDLAFALLLAGLARAPRRRGRAELAIVSRQAGSMAAHGLGHGFIWLAERSAAVDRAAPLATALSPGGAGMVVVGVPFWWGFVARTGFPAPLKAAQCVAWAVLIPLYVPRVLAFTVVNVVIACNLTLNMLLYGLDGEKDAFYALYAKCNTIITASIFAEVLLCDALLVRWGGHVVFDFSIPVALLGFLLASDRLPPRRVKES